MDSTAPHAAADESLDEGLILVEESEGEAGVEPDEIVVEEDDEAMRAMR